MTVGKKIKEIRTTMNMSLRAFSLFTDVTHTTISRIENGGDSKGVIKESVQIDIMKQICENSGYDFQTFLEETGYLTPSDSHIKKTQPTVAESKSNVIPREHAEVIALWDLMNAGQKKLILETMQNFTNSAIALNA